MTLLGVNDDQNSLVFQELLKQIIGFHLSDLNVDSWFI